MGMYKIRQIRERGRGKHETNLGRSIVGISRADTTQTEEKEVSLPWAQANTESSGADGHFIRITNRDTMGISAARNGMWVRNDMLETTEGLEQSRCLEETARIVAQEIKRGGQNRLATGSNRFRICAGCARGKKTGPNPTDRRKLGSKHHIITEAQGIPLAFQLTGANRHDVTQLLPLVDAIPMIGGQQGHPRCRPDKLYADRAYDSEPHRRQLRIRNIKPFIAKRRTKHGSGLGKRRWVVERTISWLHQYRRLRVRYERRDDIHEAFISLGCSNICWKALKGSLC